MKSLNPNAERSSSLTGPRGYLAIFAWSLLLILFAPPPKMPWAVACSLLASLVFYPATLLRIFKPRWLVFLALLILLMGLSAEPDRLVLGVPLSQDGLVDGMQMALRAVVIFIALDGISSSLDISTFAGILEQLGLRGLGFSVGVAMNLLPSLRQSVSNTWHSLWMRGGLRRRPWRSLRYFAATVIINMLRQAEEIALSAEARAYTPQCSRTLPLRRGTWDMVIYLVLGLSAAMVFLL